jgi:hypothetical protein
MPACRMYLPPTAEHRARPSHPTATHRDKRGRKEPDPGTGDRTQPILPLPPGLGKNCWAMFLLMITLSCLRSAAVKPRPARSRIPKARKYAGSTTQILRYQILAGPCRCASFDSEVDTGSPTSAVGPDHPLPGKSRKSSRVDLIVLRLTRLICHRPAIGRNHGPRLVKRGDEGGFRFSRF